MGKRKRSFKLDSAPSSSSSSSFTASVSSTTSSGFASSTTPFFPSLNKDVAVKAKMPKIDGEEKKTFEDLLEETTLKDSRDAYLPRSLTPLQIESDDDEEAVEDDDNEVDEQLLRILNVITRSPSFPLSVSEHSPRADKDDYEVERILLEHGESRHFCIKWCGYRLNESTWEVPWNLHNCDKVCKTFEGRQKLCYGIYKSLPNKDEYKGFLDTWINGIFTQTFTESCVLEDVFIKFCKSNGFGNLYVENWTQCIGLVPDFTILAENVFTAKTKRVLERNDAPEYLCDCDGCGRRHQPCKCIEVSTTLAGGLRASDAPARCITECHRKCNCGEKCVGKVFQRGRTIPVILFKTPHCGWGIRTAVDILPNKFVLEYVGLVKLYEECHNIKDETYLFNIDISNNDEKEADGEEPSKPPFFVIDATHAGNASRFINHSCDPNLEVKLVKGYFTHDGFARVTFFSNTHIKAGEELTFNYFKHEPNFALVKETTPKCRCGYDECRKFLI